MAVIERALLRGVSRSFYFINCFLVYQKEEKIMAVKYVFVTGGVASWSGKRNYRSFPGKTVKSKRLQSNHAEIRSIY